MTDFRVFCIPSEHEPVQLRLSGAESHHLVAVNRARKGAAVVAFDGRGGEWQCELVEDSKAAAVLRVRSARRCEPLPYEITLGQSLPKGPCMDAIVRKATEIGAARIIPLESERTQVHLADERQDKKLEKWQMASLEAAKQCGNPWLPEITAVQTALGVIQGSADYDLKLIASLYAGAKSLKTVLSRYAAEKGRAPKKVLWLVGPEGDFSPSEMSAALAAGFAPVTLGPLVLRCETAAVYALSILSYELGGNPS